MRKEFYLLCFMCLLNALSATGQAPTTPSSAITFSSLDGSSLRVNWTSGNGARRIVVMRQGSAVTAVPVNGVDYNPNAIFGNGDAIQPGQFVVYDNTSSFVDVTGLQPATTYHVAIFDYNGTASATQYLITSFATGSQSTVIAPTVQANTVAFSNIVGNSMTLTWVNGNGGRRLVVARQGSAVNANPVDLSFYSTGGGAFGSGTQIGTGNYVVFSGTANSVTVTGLQPAATYHYAIYEYNGVSSPVYLVPGATANATTLPRPTIAASSVTFGSIEGNSMRVNWTPGNGTRRIVVARAGSPVTAVPVDGIDYTASSAFGSGDAIQPGEFVVYDNTSSFVDLTNLSPNTVYHFRIYEYDGSGAGTAYLTSTFATSSQSTLASPVTQASNINFTNLSGTGVTVNWTNGSGTRRLLVARQGGPVNADPVDLTFYSANSFGLGSQIGTGNFVLYNGNGNSTALTGLQINTTYHFALYEFNGVSGAVYLRPGATANITTPAQPTVPASAMTFTSVDGGAMRVNWTPGNGVRRILVARAGSAVTAIPVDGVDYTANTVFGSGDAISPGEFVLYDNTNSFADISGLQPATTYHFRIYEYNGSGASTSYLTSSFASGSQATLSAPAVQASAVNFTNIAGSSARINWTNGNGSGRIVVMRQGSAVDNDPVDLVFYSANANFGSGAQIGPGNFTVHRAVNSTNFVAVTNLVPNTTYHVAVYEFNGSAGAVHLLPAATASFTTTAQPTVAASAMAFNSVEGNSMRVLWTSGNGTRRIVIARAGAAVTATPVNGTDYVASGTFGNGDAIQPGQFVVYDNASTFVDLTNLLPNTVYHFAIFEYDGTGTSASYLTSSFLSGSQSTVLAPTIQASNISFSTVTATSVTVGWTIGNGTGRIVLMRQGNPVNANPLDLQFYSAFPSFGTGGPIGADNYVVYSNTGSTVNVTNLTSGTTYHVAVYEYNGSAGRVYLVPGATGSITTPGPPQVQATNITTGSVTTTTMLLTWNNGSGNRRLVLMRQGAPVNAAPVNNGVYVSNSAFGAGTQVGTGNFVVYNSTGNSVLVTGLTHNTTYHFIVYEFNDFGATSQFLLTSPATGSGTTAVALPVTFMDFTAKNERNIIKLQWGTAQESNSSHFEIQKNAHSNTQDFITTGIVDAAGESLLPKQYSYIDDSPFEGTTYYRLKQVDKDGRYMYSKIISVKYEPKGLIRKLLNPVQQGLFIELASFNSAAQKEWKLYDMNGKLIHRETFNSQTIYGTMPAVSAGVYILEIRMGNAIERTKLLKTN